MSYNFQRLRLMPRNSANEAHRAVILSGLLLKEPSQSLTVVTRYAVEL